MSFVPSTYQQNIFDWIVTGRGDGIVNAVAGSGKTTTLIQGTKLVRGKAMFLAFNKDIVAVLKEKLRGTTTEAKTIHSLGWGCCSDRVGKGMKTEDDKYRKLVRTCVDEFLLTSQWHDDDDVPKRDDMISDLLGLVNKTRLTLTDPHDEAGLWRVCDKFGIDLYPPLLHAVAHILKRGEEIALNFRVIDFTDMIWLPYVWKLMPQYRFDWVFVDECQDLSAAALDLVLKARSSGGRMLFVGDPCQAIMGFAGADEQSFWNIKTRTNAVEMPLSICYRCPRSHILLAKQIVPHIEPRPDAPDGIVTDVLEANLPQMVREGDVILCRLTAPLISLCIHLIGMRIPARVRGRSIVDQLVNMIEAVTKLRGFSVDRFAEFVRKYEEKELFKLTKREASESVVEQFLDRMAGMMACYEAFDLDVATGDELVRAFRTELNSMFSDDRASVWLSTAHRFKGQEAERVFLLKPDRMPLTFAHQQAWEFAQEMNLKYVALTRCVAKDASAPGAFYFVIDKPTSLSAEPAPVGVDVVALAA